MQSLPHIGQVVTGNARLFPERVGARDLERSLTFAAWNARANRLANALLGLGLKKGATVAVLAYNRLEWVEIYVAAAKAGLVALPINFRLVGPEVAYILADGGAAAVIVEDVLVPTIEEIRSGLAIPAGNFIHIGAGPCPAGYRDYEELLASAADRDPGVAVAPADPWTLMYTSGTTGKPKGVVRSHQGLALHALATGHELGIGAADGALLVMPMCHANSLFFFGAFAYRGGPCAIYSRRSFDPAHLLATFASDGATFTSLVPTHYIMMLDLPAVERGRHDVSRVSRLMISSAPARAETKRAIMEFFPNSGLYEGYGSTEAGWVTMLHPDEQFTKLGSVGRECVGSLPIRILDEAGREVADGEAGELYSGTPWRFDRYLNLPDKTRAAITDDGYCTVGDMARRDADGYIHLVDRKANMIISGGENVYPSEVEAVVGAHPAVRDVAVIGVADRKWGERVHAVVVLRDGASATADELVEWCRDRIAGYKRPRSATIVRDDEMPRTATGKVLHRVLRARLATA